MGFLFYICLVTSIFYTFSNVGKVIYRRPVHWFNILAMAISLGGVITFCMGLW